VEAGARNIDHILNGELLPMISEQILSRMIHQDDLGTHIKIGVEDDQFVVTFPEPEAAE
jgi:ATP-dependent Clp protease ATP-binding subunit ClpA